MSYVIGVDGGGTKTTCLFLESDQTDMPAYPKTITGHGTNPYVIGFEAAGNRLESLIQQGMEKYSITPSEIIGIGCGMAGVGRLDDEKEMARILRKKFCNLKLFENCHLFIGSDSVAALKGAIPPEAREGMLVIAGTGSNAVGIDKSGGLHRCGGWGHLIGDEGSGYYISLKALSSVAKASDGRGPETVLTSLLIEEWKLEEPKELIRYIYNHPHEKQKIARLAKCVIEASDQNDRVAIRILEEAADELLLHVESLSRNNFQATTPVTVAGSIFTHSTIVKQYFIEQLRIRKLGMFVEPYASPEFGAALLAKPLIKEMEGGHGND